MDWFFRRYWTVIGLFTVDCEKLGTKLSSNSFQHCNYIQVILYNASNECTKLYWAHIDPAVIGYYENAFFFYRELIYFYLITLV